MKLKFWFAATTANSTGSSEQTRQNAEVGEASAGVHQVDAGDERALLTGALGQLPASTLLFPIAKSDEPAKPWTNLQPELRARKSECAVQSYLLVPGGAAVTVRLNEPMFKPGHSRRVQYVDLGNDDDHAKNNPSLGNGRASLRTASDVGTTDKEWRGGADLGCESEPRQLDGQTTPADDRKCNVSLLFAMLAGLFFFVLLDVMTNLEKSWNLELNYVKMTLMSRL